MKFSHDRKNFIDFQLGVLGRGFPMDVLHERIDLCAAPYVMIKFLSNVMDCKSF